MSSGAFTPKTELLVLHSRHLAEMPWLCHGFSTRAGGVTTIYSPEGRGELNFGNPGEDSRENIDRNRQLFLEHLCPESANAPWIWIRQIHSATVWRDPEIGAAGDALFTSEPGRVLTVRVADCVPILIADTGLRAVAAVHAGWRGTVARIVEKTVGEMRAQLGSDPRDLLAAIGPSIRRCCYQVGEEVVEAFHSAFQYADELLSPGNADPVRERYPMLFMTGAPPGHPYDPRWNANRAARLDLAEANRRQLLDAGLPASAIDVLPYCTSCRADLFFSHRRDAGYTGRIVAAIASRA